MQSQHSSGLIGYYSPQTTRKAKTMGKFKVFLLFLLIVVSVRGQSEETPQDAAALCHNDFQDKMSSTTTLRYTMKLAKNEIKQLQVSVNETQEMQRAAQDMQKAAKRKEMQLERAITSKQEFLEALLILLQNFTTEAQELHNICDGVVAIDCCQIKTVFPVANNGLYEIKDPCSGTFGKIRVRCDMETDGGGWIVIQRRNANYKRVNFTRNWEDYVNGFGDLEGEFWIGLNNIYQLTNQQEVDLQISVWNDSETSITWNYPTFRISGPEDKYRLTVSGGTGDGNRDALAYNNRQYFNTYDRGSNCGYLNQGGWWYTNCGFANLNGRHEMSGLPGIETRIEQMLTWNSGSHYEVYTNSVMMIRSKTCGLG